MRIRLRCSERRDPDSIVKVSHRVVGDHVTRSIDLDGVVASDFMRAVGAGTPPEGARPAHEQVSLLGAAKEDVVGDVEVAGSFVLAPDAESDVLESTVAHGQPDGAGDVLEASEDGNICVAERQAVEYVVGGGCDVKESVIASAVKHNGAVSRRSNRDGTVWRGLDGEPVRSVEGRHHWIDVIEAIVPV